MRINCIGKNQTSVNYRAIKVAQITSNINKNDKTFIYELEKTKDFEFCNTLRDNLVKSKNQRMQVDNKNIGHFVKNAFNSLGFSDYAAIGVRNNKPFGLMTLLSSNKRDMHLAYLFTWKTPELIKIKNGGTDLINFIFNKFQNKANIDLTPAFNSDLFYYKFGFDYDDEYERNQMSISSMDIKKQLVEFSKKSTYELVEDSKSEDLSKSVIID